MSPNAVNIIFYVEMGYQVEDILIQQSPRS